MTPLFTIGDLVMVSSPVTTGYIVGEVGLVTSVEIMGGSHFIYWVLFGKEKEEIPMWEVEIKKIS